jgi:hypothetical protein
MRMREDDNMLNKFGKDWEASRKVLPYKIFLGVY